MLFALHTLHFTFCKDDLMMVSWPKHDVKGEKNRHTVLCLTETRYNLFSVSLMPVDYLYDQSVFMKPGQVISHFLVYIEN
jgi:hypothetical protein